MCEQECQQRPRKGTQFPGTRAAASYTAMWTLSIKLWSSPNQPVLLTMGPCLQPLITSSLYLFVHAYTLTGASTRGQRAT